MKSEKEDRRGDVLRTLPGFLSQLLLLLNSGMVLQAAFHQIGESYEKLSTEGRNYFTGEICRIHQTSLRTGENVIGLFYIFSRSCGVKELSRIASIMAESMEKGTDLWVQLAEESSQLWQERKRLALEKIRLGESKMSFPLGLLMISLLLVTAAPAMMQL